MNEKIPVIIKEFGDSKAIWFENSASFIFFEEPAFDVFKMHLSNKNTAEIIEFCNSKYACKGDTRNH